MNASHDLVEKVMRNPKYQELVRRKNRISLIFFAITAVIYAGFILTLAFDPELFGSAISQGMTTSIGIVLGTLVIISAFVLVAAYVYISNKVFDPLLAEVIEELEL